MHEIKKLTTQELRDTFPIFQEYPELVYLDNGATTQKPEIMIRALTEYYTKINANVGRGSYNLALLSDKAYLDSKSKIASFFNTTIDNTIITSGATESSNLATFLIEEKLKSSETSHGKIVTSVLEHHSSFLPLQRLAKNLNFEFIVLDDLEILSNPHLLPSTFWKDVKVLGLTHVSNTTGRILPIENWLSIAKQHDVITIIDGSQAVSSKKVDIRNIASDFYYFSAHKMYGPMGLGILFISDEFKKANPYKLGGGIVDYVTKNDFTLTDSIQRFEAGTPNVANVYAFASSLDFFKNVFSLLEEQHLISVYLFEQLKNIETNTYKVHVLDRAERDLSPQKFSSLMSFIVLNKIPNERGLHSHDIGSYLTNRDICVRFGQHCAHPLHTEYHISSSVRVSLGIYNTKDDVDKFINALQEGLNKFDNL